VIAYAPSVPRAGAPWLIELELRSGHACALLEDPLEGAVINVRRAWCASRVHASLRAACEAYALGPASDLELRWWRGVSIDDVTAVERARRGADATLDPRLRADISPRPGPSRVQPTATSMRVGRRAS
jgi:hypothetical protein